MTRRAALAAAVAALAAVGPAAAWTRTLRTSAAVTTMAASAPEAAVAVAARPGDCDHVQLWSWRTGRTLRLGRAHACGPATSTGQGLASVSNGGGRALWLTYVGGNIREWSLWTGTWTRPQPRLLRFVPRDVDLPGPIVLGPADATTLAYAVDETVVGLAPAGARRFTWTAPARVTALAVHAGATWVALAGGGLYELDERGRPTTLRALEGDASALAVDGLGVFAQVGRTLEARLGTATKTFRLASGARLVDATGYRAVYLTAGRVRVHAFSSGRDVSYPGQAAAVEGRALVVGGQRGVAILPLPPA